MSVFFLNKRQKGEKMSASGIHAAVGRVIHLTHLKGAMFEQCSSLERSPLDFPALINLLITDITVMREGKDVQGVYNCMKGEIQSNRNLDRCAQTLLNFYENTLPAMGHMVVEDKVCQYIKLKAFDMLNKYMREIDRIAQGRPLSTLKGEELQEVLRYEDMILKIIPTNISEEEKQSILTYVQEVLRGGAASEIKESDDLSGLNRVVEQYQLGEVVQPLDGILKEAKDLVCSIEEGSTLGDISKYLATIRFLMTILSTHSIMVKKEQMESVGRLQSIAGAIRHMYEQHGLSCSPDVEQRVQSVVNLKEIEILRSGKLLALEPVDRTLPKSDSDIEEADYEDYLMAYAGHMRVINKSIDSLKSVLTSGAEAKKVFLSVTVELSDYFLKEIYPDGDPLGANIQEVVKRLLNTPIEAVDAKFVNDIIKLLMEEGKIIHKDHFQVVIEESIRPNQQAAASAEAQDDQVNAQMRTLLQQLSII